MQRASKQRSSRCDHPNSGPGTIQWMDATKCVVCLSFVTSLHRVICNKLVLKSVSYPKIVKNTPILIEQSIACNVYT